MVETGESSVYAVSRRKSIPLRDAPGYGVSMASTAFANPHSLFLSRLPVQLLNNPRSSCAKFARSGSARAIAPSSSPIQRDSDAAYCTTDSCGMSLPAKLLSSSPASSRLSRSV